MKPKAAENVRVYIANRHCYKQLAAHWTVVTATVSLEWLPLKLLTLLPAPESSCELFHFCLRPSENLTASWGRNCQHVGAHLMLPSFQNYFTAGKRPHNSVSIRARQSHSYA